MRCANRRERLQDWLDQPGAPSLPPDLAEHVRVCAGCRGYIKQWNGIELGLQALRLEIPPPSPNLAMAIRTRAYSPVHGTERRSPFLVRRLALVGATAAALALIALLGVRLLSSAPHPSTSTLAIMRPDAAAHAPGAPPGIGTDLPLAETR